ncbi:MAG: gamma-butyrolactone biosynthesis protein [Actinophytocola sp.]|uniref:AfsA-related hotdog domain-containing protein n=1 Tax=Actinophytocola sp. TaxID=1872138 RepID=UPI00132813CD|nr:AfsA-related hotdog domain-containing protein [Actinophytocola sp.]MPZ83085.1 gamma-butyrolactone biosynthesis protein [Actinophytocola sp.]
MSMTPDGAPARLPAPELRYASTVDRTMIHRRNASEAFVTDVVRTGRHGFAAGALLPSGHPHYAGHTGPSRDRDPMLLLECARQAETYAAHALFGVEPDTRFVLRGWSADFAAFPLVPDPAELLITAVTRNPKVVRDRIRGLDHDLDLWAAGARVGRVSMTVGYVSAAAFAVLRSRTHGGPPPSSDDLRPPNGHPVEPARVGRVRATDAVLLDVVTREGAVTAGLRVAAENSSLFDHSQDHVPAMVLVEAARQLAALATGEWGHGAPDRTEMVAMRSSFSAYAELTEPIELTATPVAAAVPSGRSVEVTFRQTGQEIARARIAMAVRGSGGGVPWLGRR